MSTTGKRDFRPNIHFTPEKNWINDPNGLVYVNGTYHLFAQYHPYSTVWGPMHWAHATSTDLTTWTHQPVALAPDELGQIFSGSCVYDKDNTSGFGTAENPPMVAMYTSHGEHEQQSIAYSVDGIHFEKYECNPVIANDTLKDFRDPKVFWNRFKSCWSVILAAGDRVHFYSSSNLKDWEKTGEFGTEGNYAHYVWECPDIFPLTCDGEEKWILLASMIFPVEEVGSRTQYFIGTFDGDTFVADPCFDNYELIDDGFDNYAGVSYFNTDEVILMGWGINWRYARVTPTNEYCGMMTLPRKLSLVKTPKDGMRLASSPIFNAERFTAPTAIASNDQLPGETFALTISGSDACKVTFKNKEGQTLCFGVNAENEVFIDRTNAGANDFDPDGIYKMELFSKTAVKRFYEGEYTITVMFDVSSTELYIDQGTRNFTAVVFPDSPYQQIEIDGAVTATISSLL